MGLFLVPLVHDAAVLVEVSPRLEHGATLVARVRPRVRGVHMPRELVPPQDVRVALCAGETQIKSGTQLPQLSVLLKAISNKIGVY